MSSETTDTHDTLKEHQEAAQSVWGEGTKIEVSAPKKEVSEQPRLKSAEIQAPELQESLFTQDSTKEKTTGDIFKRGLPLYAVDIVGNIAQRVKLEEASDFVKKGYEIKIASAGRTDFIAVDLCNRFGRTTSRWRLTSCYKKPSQIVESESFYTAYWFIKDIVDPEDQAEIEAFDEARLGIFKYFQINKPIIEISKMRFVPGFADSSGFMVKTILNNKKHYTVEELLRGYPGGANHYR